MKEKLVAKLARPTYLSTDWIKELKQRVNQTLFQMFKPVGLRIRDSKEKGGELLKGERNK